MGLFGASVLGMATTIGTGIFVSLGIAAGISGSGVVLALILAGITATINSFNDVQLSVNQPVSGGVYEYGYTYLTPWLGFTGGWVYLLARTTAAATAALGFSGYLLKFLNLDVEAWLVPVALMAVAGLTSIASMGVKLSRSATAVTVSITFISLLALVFLGFWTWPADGHLNLQLTRWDAGGRRNLLEASALLFVAYGGYGRIATMGEDIANPRRTIPRAIALTMGTTVLLYVLVAIVSLGTVGAETLGAVARERAAPLEVVVARSGIQWAPPLLAVGAIAAMLSVSLSGILGLSRVFLAMGRRGDMPHFLSRLNKRATAPPIAVIVVGVLIGALVLTGDVRITWSFSAFANLSRCLLTGLAALRMSHSDRLYPRWLTWLGLFPCLLLLFWLDRQVSIVGMQFIGIGLVWHFVMAYFSGRSKNL